MSIYQRFEFLANTPEDDSDKLPTTVPDFSKFYHPGINKGDPVSWVVAHAKTVRLVLELHGAINDKQQLKTKLEELTIHTEEYGNWPLEYRYAQRGELYSKVVQTARRNETDVEFAQGIIRDIVNANLDGGVSRELLIDLEPEDRRNPKKHRQKILIPVLHANSLIDGIYWHLADAIAGSTIKRCLFCKRFFNATHLKRLYCPPPMGMEGEGSCAQNDRARRGRQGKKEAPKNGRIRSRKTKE